MKLPTPLEMHLLSLVAHDELAGREVARRYTEETGKSISYGTLYTTFRRLKETGWVDVRDDHDDDGRIRYFKLTANGRIAVRDGAAYYAEIVGFAKTIGGFA